MPNIQIDVSITAEKISGKFVSNDELIDQITEELDSAISNLSLEFDQGEYEVTDYTVDVVPDTPKPPKTKK
jgi:hypothetical protein